MELISNKKKKVKVELHVHTNHSYDSQTPFWQIIEKCKAKGIDVLGISDHNEIGGAFGLQKIAPFRVIVGQEVLTKEGEVIGFFLKKFITPLKTMYETVEEIKKQGGVVYVPHPRDNTTRKTSIDPEKLSSLIDKIDIIEIHNGRTVYPWDNSSAREFAIANNKAMAIGSDAHTKYEFGRNYMMMKDFSNSQQFIESLQNSEQQTSYVLPWVFFLTKYFRLRKRLSREHIEKITKNCDLCGGKNVTILYKKKGQTSKEYLVTDDSYGVHSQIVKCMGCGLIFVCPIENNLNILKRYQDFKDPLYEKERVARCISQQNILQRLEKMVGVKSILDVGCATGGLLSIARDRGWNTFGIEPSKWAVKIAKEEYKLNVVSGTLENSAFRRKFEAITCIDVIEHVLSPREFLKQINRLLDKDSVLCIVTPDKNSLAAQMMGEQWWHIRPDHITYFDKHTLIMLLESSGFKVEVIKRYKWTFSYDYWSSRFKNRLPWVYRTLTFLKKMPLIKNLAGHSYGLNFHDSLEMYCTKQKNIT